MGKKVIVTGSSGLLGRAVTKLFVEKEWEVIGVCHSRSEENNPLRRKIDLLDESEVSKLITQEKPDVIVHWVTERLGKLAADNGGWVLFISTDYVFDGTKPPYASNSETHPLNFYGETKRDAENALWKSQADAGILRVPVLYGNVSSLEESAITVLARHFLDSTPVSIDDVQKRYPTHVDDVAFVCWQLSERKLQHCGLYGKEQFTKYQLLKEMATMSGFSIDHVTPSYTPDPSKPNDAQLNCLALEVMGIGHRTPFREGITPFLDSLKK